VLCGMHFIFCLILVEEIYGLRWIIFYNTQMASQFISLSTNESINQPGLM
jgi:hypothetical protein